MESYVIQLAVNKRKGFSIEFVAQQELLDSETMEREAEQLKSLFIDSLPSYTMDQLRDKINEKYRSYDKVKDEFPNVLRMFMDDNDAVVDWAQEKSELDSLKTCIAELEAGQRWIPVSERLPNKSGWYLAGLIGWAGGYYTGEVHFDAETGLPWRSSVRDEVYCWLDGVPELPKPPEVQE